MLDDAIFISHRHRRPLRLPKWFAIRMQIRPACMPIRTTAQHELCAQYMQIIFAYDDFIWVRVLFIVWRSPINNANFLFIIVIDRRYLLPSHRAARSLHMSAHIVWPACDGHLSSRFCIKRRPDIQIRRSFWVWWSKQSIGWHQSVSNMICNFSLHHSADFPPKLKQFHRWRESTRAHTYASTSVR